VHIAARQLDGAVALKVLLSHDPNLAFARDSEMYTPLHNAAFAGAVDGVKLLIDSGADVNAVTRDGSTPLHFTWGRLAFVANTRRSPRIERRRDSLASLRTRLFTTREVLLSHGANLEARTESGLTASQDAFSALRDYGTRGEKFGSEFGSGIYSWENAPCSCRESWHTEW
jgi:hypothetical protein